MTTWVIPVPVTRTATATLTATAALGATTTATRAAVAALGATATLAAAATVSGPTDISSLLTEGTGSHNPGGLVVPGYDQAYRVTVADARFPSYPTVRTPGVRVTLPLPETPNAPHSLTITYTIADRDRRVFHDPRTRWRIDGTVTEPNPTTGQTTTISYAWDTTAHEWHVSGTTGSPTIRTHGPNESTGTVPLYFTPECRALGSFSTIKAAQLNALAALPSQVSSYLTSVGVVADIPSDTSGNLLELMTAREIFDPAWQSGAFGFFWDPFTNAYPWVRANGMCDGRTLLHELGHAWDRHALASVGATWGIDPVSPGSPNAYDTVRVYYPDGVTLDGIYTYTPTTLVYEIFDTDGVTVIWGGTLERQQYAMFSNEDPIRTVYAAVPDKSGSYYRSTVTEWAAQCFMLVWADHVSGYSAAERNTLITEVGGASILADFIAYAVSVGVLPSSW